MLRRASLFQPFEFFQFVCDEIEKFANGKLTCKFTHKGYKLSMIEIHANDKTDKHIGLHLPVNVAIAFEYNPNPFSKIKDMLDGPATVFRVEHIEIVDKNGNKGQVNHAKQIYHMELFSTDTEDQHTLMSLMLTLAAGIYHDVDDFLKIQAKSKPANIHMDHSWLTKFYQFLGSEISQKVHNTFFKIKVDELHAEISLHDKNEGDDDAREQYPVKLWFTHTYKQPSLTSDDMSLIIVGEMLDPKLFEITNLSIVTQLGRGITKDLKGQGYALAFVESMKAQNVKDFVQFFAKIVTDKFLFPLI